ncbi:MAG: rhodanese-like domain-containing protein [Bacteroidetes bacterium]|jgi:rhodanese-related sulfurtransferase|nr:rhodanese-like domain-containing protein [Bacteroidota bacterium]MDF1864237.1 rhodanese-like domain-containing protein [Saprospiraceae bacterium]
MEENCKIGRWEILKRQLKNLSPHDFQQAFENSSNGLLIDCRRPDEFNTGYIPNAINLDYLGEEFYNQMEVLDPSTHYFVYCRSSRRSIRTCTLMQNSGFENVFNLDGGLNGWVNIFGADTLIQNTPL